MSTNHGKVLISGASIAGPSLAYWLDRSGFEVTVVEKASALRGGGYPIDVRGTAVDVASKMGMLDVIRRAHIDTRCIKVVDGDGRPVQRIRPEAATGGIEGRDFELARGDLAAALSELTVGKIEYIFGDSIASMAEAEGKVEVELASGGQRTYDLVFGADGLHSNVRRLVFGPEAQFHRYLGWCFAGFTLPNYWDLSHESILWNVPGKMATVFAAGEKPDRLYSIMAMKCAQPPEEVLRDEARVRDLVIAAFKGEAWEVPLLIRELTQAADFFCDGISQITMPTWSKGRVALVGDAAHATSFKSGQGSSCALVTPYVLAGELTKSGDHKQAFARYESITRSFVEENQAIAHRTGSVCIAEARDLRRRNALLRWGIPVLTKLGLTQLMAAKSRRATTAIELPDYSRTSVTAAAPLPST